MIYKVLSNHTFYNIYPHTYICSHPQNNGHMQKACTHARTHARAHRHNTSVWWINMAVYDNLKFPHVKISSCHCTSLMPPTALIVTNHHIIMLIYTVLLSESCPANGHLCEWMLMLLRLGPFGQIWNWTLAQYGPVVMLAGVVYLIKTNLLIGPHSWSGKQFCSLSS